MKTLAAILLAVAAATTSVPAHADTYSPPPVFAKAPGLPAGYDEATALRLDLASALQIAMEQNIGMSVERSQVDAVDLGERAAHGAMYEPVVTAGFSHSSQVTPPMTKQAGAADQIITATSDAWTVGVSNRLPTGGSVGVSVSLDRYASSSGTAVLPDYYTSGASITFTQPLLRGFSRDLVIPQMSLLTAKIATESERYNIQLVASQLVQQTEGAYWNVVSALYAYRVAVDAKASTDDALELMRKQIAAGTTGTADLAQAEAAAAQQQVTVLDQATQVENAWDALRLLLNLPRDQWQRPILPTDVPSYDVAPSPSIDDAISVALHQRPEIHMMQLETKSEELAMRKAENDKLPQIDLQLGAGMSGLGASAGESIGELGGSTTSWNVGVALTWTPFQKANNANLELQKVQRQMHDAQHDLKIQQIWTDVRSAVRARESARMQVQAASRSRELATAALAAETKKYMSGMSSMGQVALQRQALTNAQQQEVTALVNSERANTQLLVATGGLLAARHVVLQVVTGAVGG